jgi:hypothetical protein
MCGLFESDGTPSDGRLTAVDPVWNELKVWQDGNQNGVQEATETHTLSSLGISELNYAMGTFTQNGQLKQLASPDLQADKDGSKVTVVKEGILVQASADGHLSLLVTRVDDRTALQANRDGITGFEDIEAIVNSADLLANDSLGGFKGSNLTLTGVNNFRHGSGFVDANGFVHFSPTANHSGIAAGFDYVSNHYQNRSCLRPNLLGYRPKNISENAQKLLETSFQQS